MLRRVVSRQAGTRARRSSRWSGRALPRSFEHCRREPSTRFPSGTGTALFARGARFGLRSASRPERPAAEPFRGGVPARGGLEVARVSPTLAVMIRVVIVPMLAKIDLGAPRPVEAPRPGRAWLFFSAGRQNFIARQAWTRPSSPAGCDPSCQPRSATGPWPGSSSTLPPRREMLFVRPNRLDGAACRLAPDDAI